MKQNLPVVRVILETEGLREDIGPIEEAVARLCAIAANAMIKGLKPEDLPLFETLNDRMSQSLDELSALAFSVNIQVAPALVTMIALNNAQASLNALIAIVKEPGTEKAVVN